VLGGPGIYYRKVEITRFDGYVPGVYCDPSNGQYLPLTIGLPF